MLATTLLTHRDESFCLLLLTHDDHIWNALQLVITNLAANLLVAVVERCTHALLLKVGSDLLSIVVVLLGDGQNGHLLGCEPEWEMASRMLDEHSCESLHRTEGSTVNHHGRLLRVVLGGVFQLETLWEVVVNLNGTQLPTTSDSVFHHEVELRTIEGSLAIFNFCIKTFLFASIDDGLLTLCPNLVGANVFLLVVRIAKRNLSLHILEVEDGEHGFDNVHHAHELAFHLIGAAEDVSIVLCERTNTSEAVQLTTLLITIDRSELGNAKWQVFV